MRVDAIILNNTIFRSLTLQKNSSDGIDLKLYKIYFTYLFIFLQLNHCVLRRPSFLALSFIPYFVRLGNILDIW